MAKRRRGIININPTNLYQKQQVEVFQEFLYNNMSHTESYVDYEKMKKVITDEVSIIKMNNHDFENYRLKLFYTNLSVFDKAIQKAKHGRKGNKMEHKYLSDVERNITAINTNIKTMKESLY